MKKYIDFYVTVIMLIALVSCKATSSKNSKVIEEKFFSNSLNEERKFKIYFPNNFEVQKKIPIVYTTDGQYVVDNYKNKLDSLIENNIISPLIIVGVFSNEREVNNTVFEYRSFEYLKNFGTDDTLLNQLYFKHKIFFLEEVQEFIKKKYNISSVEDIFYGFSNGADFGYDILINNCSKYDYYLLYSLTGSNRTQENKPNKICNSKIFISYGLNENESLKEKSNIIKDSLKNNNYFIEVDVFNGKHNRKDWQQQFFKDLIKIDSKQ